MLPGEKQKQRDIWGCCGDCNARWPVCFTSPLFLIINRSLVARLLNVFFASSVVVKTDLKQMQGALCTQNRPLTVWCVWYGMLGKVKAKALWATAGCALSDDGTYMRHTDYTSHQDVYRTWASPRETRQVGISAMVSSGGSGFAHSWKRAGKE